MLISGAQHQLYPVVVRYYDQSIGRVVSGLLALPPCEDHSTGENIFKLLEKEVEQYSTWSQCIGYCSDNAAVMMGHKKGVAAFVKEKHSNIFISGCTCHLLQKQQKVSQSPLKIL
jgi:hypothetical protein